MKIFGIGLSKTGTTSLAQALKILGYKAVHNPFSMLNYNDDVLSLDYTKVDLYDALTDIQIARFYKELDTRYPGSKFILTTREMRSWLGSCKNHFHDHRKSFVKAAALHMDIYGTNSYDEKKLSDAYSQHYNEVIEYFRGRDSDLLILDVSENNKWQKLCKFLDKPIPNKAYPMKNKAIPIPTAVKNIIRRFGVGKKAIRAIKKRSYNID